MCVFVCVCVCVSIASFTVRQHVASLETGRKKSCLMCVCGGEGCKCVCSGGGGGGGGGDSFPQLFRLASIFFFFFAHQKWPIFNSQNH